MAGVIKHEIVFGFGGAKSIESKNGEGGAGGGVPESPM